MTFPVSDFIGQLNLSDDQIEKLDLHLKLVLKHNKETNLTRIASLNEGLLLHIEDSLQGISEIEEAPEGLYGDMGTGGGFPGIPLAIYSGRQTVLIDSTKKKTAILDSIVKELGLSEQISTCNKRIEEISLQSRGSFAVLTARALCSLPSLLELSSPLLQQGGRLICYKALQSDDEYHHALSLSGMLSLQLVSDRKFVLSDSSTQRRILVFQKSGNPSIELPRRVGVAQKKPLTVK